MSSVAIGGMRILLLSDTGGMQEPGVRSHARGGFPVAWASWLKARFLGMKSEAEGSFFGGGFPIERGGRSGDAIGALVDTGRVGLREPDGVAAESV